MLSIWVEKKHLKDPHGTSMGVMVPAVSMAAKIASMDSREEVEDDKNPAVGEWWKGSTFFFSETGGGT